MPEYGVSEFSSIAAASGTPKINKIRKIATRGEYQFYRDYYGPLRNAIKSLFVRKRHISHLYEISRRQKKPHKKVNFEKVSDHFKDWQSGKNITAATPPSGHFNYLQTSINCNPELNVTVNGEPRLVKLHFNSTDKMTQERANIICYLMSDVVNDDTYSYSVLDLTNGKEYFFNGNSEKMLNRVYSEIETIQNNWL